MTDDKKIKYLMRCRQLSSSKTQICKKTENKNYIQRRARINAYSNKFFEKSNIGVTIIVHRKMKCKLFTLYYDSLDPVKTLKRNSTTTFKLNNNGKEILTKFSASLQNLSDHSKKMVPDSQNYLNIPNFAKWDVYRCQFSTQEESCCCSCNSDAMFEVMKSLYDCYKKKNCDHCNCILCGHLPREERRLGELRKSGMIEAGIKEKKVKRKIKSKELLTTKQSKTAEEKEATFKKKVLSGVAVPERKTPSEKVKTKQVAPLSKSENKLYKKTEAQAAGVVSVSTKVPSEKIEKAKKEGLLTPLEGKTAEQKKKILRGLAMNGIPLPAAKSKSERNLIDQVRIELGLPPEPKTESEKKKYKKALVEGLIIPLEGKTPEEKEDLLRKQAEAGLHLPKGRTPSEKALIISIEQAIRPPSEHKVPSEKMLKAKVAGIVTPLTGKTPAQKENILRSLALNGIPLPEGKTESEKKLIHKVRVDLALPPEPKTAAEKTQYKKALAAGLLIPLEGKTTKQKEDILRKQAEIGLILPTGRTPSEKSLILKIQQTVKPQPELKETFKKENQVERENALKNLALQGKVLPETKTQSEVKIMSKVTRELKLPPKPKSRDEKEIATGKIKPLEEKSKSEIKSEKRKAPLPPAEIKKIEAKTARKMKESKGPSDECICDILTPESEKVDFKSRVSLEKLRKGKESGTLTPLKGKSIKERERIKAETGKITTAAIKSKSVGKIPSEKLKAAKAAGLLTPLKGKPTKEKEKIIRGLVKEGLPLPESNTVSEKKLIEKVRKDLGIPVSGISSEKLRKAKEAGLITPLKGKDKAQKEKILKERIASGLPLPEAATPSDKDLIKKIKTESGYKTPMDVRRKSAVAKIASEKLKAAKAAGLLTPLKGKSTKEKEKIIRGLVKEGLPLPESNTVSEKKLIEKVRKDLGIPVSGISSEKLRKAKEAGLITPLKGKDKAQKEKILKERIASGLPLPEAATPSDKDLIKKIKTETGYKTPMNVRRKSAVAKIASEKLKAAKAAGLLTPLKGKSTEEKERIIRGLVKEGLPLPESNTVSEKKLIEKVSKDLGIPVSGISSEKLRKAKKAELITPLKGKEKAQKEKILKERIASGLPLPEGATPSDKDLIKKIKTETEYKTPMEVRRKSAVAKIASEKLKAAKAAGLLTPLKGKSTKEKERIIRGLVKEGLPLPESNTMSEKKLIEKVRKDLGIPVSRIPSEKLRKVKEAGIMKPLEEKSKPEIKSQKRRRAKSLSPVEIKKIETKTAKNIKESKGPSDECICDILTPESEKVDFKSRVSLEKLRKAKASGTLTPFKGKSIKEKERIKAETGKTTPVAVKSKSAIAKIPSNKLKIARDAGLLTPLKGKSSKEKEKIIRGLAKEGLPFPTKNTASEAKLIEKVRKEEAVLTTKKSEMIDRIPITASKRYVKKKKAESLIAQKEKIVKELAETGLPFTEGKTLSENALVEKIPHESTVSEKRRTIKTKSRKTGVDKIKKSEIAVGVGKAKTGITEEFQEIVKTTTCDRSCGCDRKKIRFKHSYVKIRVTSPDISSLCPCPDECLPGVKGGVFTDNEGIKVTVGQVSGAPSFTSKEYTKNKRNSEKRIEIDCKKDKAIITSISSDSALLVKNKLNCVRILDIKSPNEFNNKDIQNKSQHSNYCRQGSSETLIFFKSSDNLSDSNLSIDVPLLLDGIESSFFSSVSNLSIFSNSISILSISVTNCSSNSAYLIERTLDYSSQSKGSLTDIDVICQEDFSTSMSIHSSVFDSDFRTEIGSNNILYDHPIIFRLSAQKVNDNYLDELISNKRNDYQETPDKIANVISKILSKQTLSQSSSLYVLLPTSSEENSSVHVYYDSEVSSTICIQLSEKPLSCRGCLETSNRQFRQQQKKLRGLKIFAKGKHEYTAKDRVPEKIVDIKPTSLKMQTRFYEICTDTTEDRPCCCDKNNAQNTMKNVISEFMTPFIIKNPVSRDKVNFLGLNNDNYDVEHEAIGRKDVSYMTRKLGDYQTPIRLCKIPPCGSFSGDHTLKNFENMQISNDLNFNELPSSTSKKCGCDFKKIKEILENIEKDLASKSCGSSSEKLGIKMAKENQNIKPNSRKRNFQESPKSIDCTSCVKSGTSQEKKKQCPCERYIMRKDNKIDQTTPSKLNYDNIKSNTFNGEEKNNDGKKKNKKHNNICECPSSPQEEEIDSVVWLDEEEIRRMKSVLSQNISGFKIATMPKVPEPEMSLEEALSYVIQSDKEKYGKLLCLCHEKNRKKKAKKKNHDCECPPEITVPEKVPEEELKGIKLHISGKGSSSKGLSGILCFQLLIH